MTSLVTGSDRIDPDAVENSLHGIKWPSNIEDVVARGTKYCGKFFERLDTVGCLGLVEGNPKKTVNIFMRRVQPTDMKSEMQRQTRFDTKLEKLFICSLHV